MPECGYYKDWYDVWKAGLSGISPAGCGHLSGGGFATVLCSAYQEGVEGWVKQENGILGGSKKRAKKARPVCGYGGIASDTVSPKRELGKFPVTQWGACSAVQPITQ